MRLALPWNQKHSVAQILTTQKPPAHLLQSLKEASHASGLEADGFIDVAQFEALRQDEVWTTLLKQTDSSGLGRMLSSYQAYKYRTLHPHLFLWPNKNGIKKNWPKREHMAIPRDWPCAKNCYHWPNHLQQKGWQVHYCSLLLFVSFQNPAGARSFYSETRISTMKASAGPHWNVIFLRVLLPSFFGFHYFMLLIAFACPYIRSLFQADNQVFFCRFIFDFLLEMMLKGLAVVIIRNIIC